MKVLFRKFEDKKWSTRYNECDANGNDISTDIRNTQIGAIYIKKDSEIGKLSPEIIEVEIRKIK